MLDRKKVLKIKLEGTSGTAETTPDQAIYAEDFSLLSTAEYVKRAGSGLYIGNKEVGLHGNETGHSSFRTPLMGTGSSGMGLGCAILLQTAWLKKTSESYQVTSVVTNWKTLTLDGSIDGIKKRLFGAMSNITLDWEAGRAGGAYLACELDGLLSPITDVGLPEYAPAVGAPMHLISFKINNVAKKIHTLSLNLQNVVVPWSDPNAAAVLRSNVMPETEIAHFIITDNDPQITIDPEAELVAAYDFDGIRRAGTEHAIEAIFSDGTDTITVTLAKVQIVECPHAEREGQVTHKYVGQCNHDSGDDSVVIAVT